MRPALRRAPELVRSTPISWTAPFRDSGAVAVNATSSESISALVAAGSAALTAGGAAGVGVSFGGAFGFNEVSVSTHAYVDGGTGHERRHADLQHHLQWPERRRNGHGGYHGRRWRRFGGGVLGGAAGVSVTIALSIARNTITDDQEAYISGVKSLNAGSGTVSAEATEGATIEAGAFAASLAAGISGVAGVAVSGAATTTENLIEAKVDAYIADSTIASAGAVTVQVRYIDDHGDHRCGLGGAGRRHCRRRRLVRRLDCAERHRQRHDRRNRAWRGQGLYQRHRDQRVRRALRHDDHPRDDRRSGRHRLGGDLRRVRRRIRSAPA